MGQIWGSRLRAEAPADDVRGQFFVLGDRWLRCGRGRGLARVADRICGFRADLALTVAERSVVVVEAWPSRSAISAMVSPASSCSVA